MKQKLTKAELQTELEAAQKRIARLERAMKKSKSAQTEPLQGMYEQLTQLLEILPVGISILDSDLKVVFENPTLLHILDMNVDDLRAGRYKDRKYLASDGSPMPPEKFASAQAQISGRPVYNVETGIVKEDGETIWINASAVPVNFPDWKTVIVTTNITPRKKAELALRESEARYRLIAENSADVIWVLDPMAGKFTYVSPSVEKLRGFTPEEVMAQPVNEALTPESLKIVSDSLQINLPAFIAKGSGTESFINEVDQPCKDGSVVHTEVTTTYLFNEQGKVEIVGVSRDITERKQMEEALKQSEEMFRTVFDNSPVAIELYDKNSALMRCNKRVNEMFGVDTDTLIGRFILKDDPNYQYPEVWEKLQRGEEIQHEISFDFGKTPYSSQKRGIAYYHIITTPVPSWISKDIGYIVQMVDITERKRAEAELRVAFTKYKTLFENFPLGITVSDPQGNILETNAVAETLLGLSKEDQQKRQIGGAEWNIIRPDGTPMTAEEYASVRALKGGQKVENVELGIVKPDASVTWLNVTAAPLPLEGYGVVIAYGDVTARKQAEEKLRESEAKYRSLIDSQESAISTIDVEGVFHYINANGAAPFGDPELVIGKKLGDLFPSHIADWQLMQVRQVIASGQGLVTEYHSQVAGKPSWRRVSIQPIFDAEGRVTLATINSLDITERKQVENQLSTSERRYRQLFENMNNGFVLFEVVQNEQGLPVDLVILAGNTGFEKTTGLNLSEAVGKRLTQVLPGIENDAADWVGTYGKVALTGEPRQFEQGSERLGYFYSVSAFQAEPGQCAVTFLDITERKLAEAELRESEERFSTAFFTSPVSQSIIAQESNDILAVNDACCRLFGYQREELIGAKAATLNLWENPADRLAALEELRKTGRLHLQETTARVKSGEIRTIMVAIEPILWKGFSCLISSIFDITDRKTVERLLQASERNYRELVQNANSAIIRWKRDGTIVFFNEFAQAFFGYRLEQIIGQPVGILVPETDSTGGDLSSLVRNIVEHPEQFVNVVNENVCSDGRRVWMAWTNKPVYNENGEVIEILAVGSDITERKRAEEQMRASEAKFKAVFDNAPVGISLLDPERKLLESNEMLSRIVRIDAEGLADGKYRNRKYIREDGTEIPTSELASTRAIVERQIVRDVVNGIILEDGEVIWTQVSAAPLGQSDPRTVVITQDITKRKQAEAQLRITLEELRRSNAELEQFAYIASHDLQEPLRSMAGMVQLLQRRYQGQLDERADEYIGHAVEAAGRMQSLINDLLAFSRVDRRGAPLAPVTVDVCIADALKNLEATVRESGAEVTWDEMPTVVADETQLTQLLQNLISNGIKFKGEEPPRIHIGAQKLQNAWQFSVRDNGIGIEPQYFERIFLLFQRLHTRREYPGTGIGLALCKKIVERHDGVIWVESEPGKGATFHFTIPFRSTP